MLVCKIQKITLLIVSICWLDRLFSKHTKTLVHQTNEGVENLGVKNIGTYYPELQATDIRCRSHLWFRRIKLCRRYFFQLKLGIYDLWVQMCLWEMKETGGRKRGCVSLGTFLVANHLL